MTNTIKLIDIVSDWDAFRTECMENMFYQFEHGNMNALKESSNSYRYAIDMHTKLYCINVYYNMKKQEVKQWT